MSKVTVASLQRMMPERLAELLLSEKVSNVAVVDVRDDDHVGGHIHGSKHVPSSALDHRIPEIVRTLADKEIVVFHCALSQQRGPSAALRYIREREIKMRKGEIGSSNEPSDLESKVEDLGRGSSNEREQEVFVLDRGFVGWQQKYGMDQKLTDAYAPDIWADY